MDALVKINAIPKAHADEMYKMSFQRAARTDKGVSAVRNLLSLKMEFDENETLKKLNDLLPKQIRVFGYNKVTQSFDCKTNCDARTYVYLLPTFAFCPIEQVFFLLSQYHKRSCFGIENPRVIVMSLGKFLLKSNQNYPIIPVKIDI